MKLFSSLYRRAMAWSRHPHAHWYLGGLSFSESSFFSIPPDVMLAPTCLALQTTLASLIGRGVVEHA